MKSELTRTQQDIVRVCDSIKEMLIEKNRSYGDSALNPVNLFAHDVTPINQISVRIDDKLSRIARGHEYPGDDTIKDILGYLVLYIIARERQEES